MKKELPNKRIKIVVVLGQTATGKSAVAVRLARLMNGEVISADSRQVYRGLNLSTGKITPKETRGVPHHLIDIVRPRQQFSVAEYTKLADKAIDDISRRGKVPIICGGTGLYIDAVLGKIGFPEIAPNKKLRKRLSNKTTKQLFEILKQLDPRRARLIDKNNPRRLVRAIEIAESIGRVTKVKKTETKYDALQIGLTMPLEKLREKIHTRLLSRIKLGMIREANNLLTSRALSLTRMKELGLEQRFLAEYLNKKITKKEMLNQLENAIWHYTKRQKTWFKRDKNTHWFDVSKKGFFVKMERLVARTLPKK